MQLTSPAFTDNGLIPSIHTCDGDNISPPLSISQVPKDAVSLALIVDDPDAPGGDWVHWLVWNLDPQTETIEANDLPLHAIAGLNDFGQEKYGGPCPPSGMHRYQFKLFALDINLDLAPTADKPTLLKAISNHIIADTVLTAFYQRQ